MTDDRMETITDPAAIRATDEPDERGDFPCCTTPAPVGAGLDLDAVPRLARLVLVDALDRAEAAEAEVRRLTEENASYADELLTCDREEWRVRAEAAEALDLHATAGEVARLRRNLTATAQDATDAKCARDAARREADQLRHLLGSHADGHRCTCTMTDPGVYHGDNMHPPEWEQDPWCPTHPHMPYVIEEHRKALARAEAAEAEVGTLRAKVAAVEALADQWADRKRSDGMSGNAWIGLTLSGVAADLRAALATTGEGQ